jgi:hypothetical protein
MDERLADLLRTIDEAHERIAEAIRTLPEDRVLDHVAGHWTRKDVIGHLAWWHDHSTFVLTELRAGRVPYPRDDPTTTTDALNAKSQAERAGLSLEQVTIEEADTYRRLLETLRAADADALMTPGHFEWTSGEALVETIHWDTDRHYADHLEHLTT